MSDTSPPRAGWYADPEDPAGERWWNGSAWSDHKRPSTVATVAAADASTPAAETSAAAAVPPVPSPTGFTYGTPATGDSSRPDPYAAYAAPQYSAPAYGAPAYGAPAYGSSGTNGLAVAGLVVSAAGWLVLGVLASITGIVLSAIGLSQAKKREAAGIPNSGRGLAMAGLVVGIIVTIIGVLVIVAYVGLFVSAISNSGSFS